MKVAGVIFSCCCLLIDLELLCAITVKPSNSPPIIENSRGDSKTNVQTKEEDRVVRYTPFVDVRQQQLDNLNFVRYLQSLPKSNLQIPSVGYLYGALANKPTPLIQAGFIYKARPQGNYESSGKDSYQSATTYPIYNRQVPPDSPKYQLLYNRKPTAISIPKAKFHTPFLPSNKIPGAWQPINNLHKPHYIKGQVLSVDNNFVRHISLTNPSSSSSEEFIPIPNHPFKQHVPNTTPSTAPFTKHYLKSDTKSITILNPEYEKHSVPALNYEHSRYAAKATTTTAPKPEIVIPSDHSSRQPIESYEFEEQIIYELQPHIANKSTEISEDVYNNQFQQQQHSIDHANEEREELTSNLHNKIESTSENIKPHLNLTPVPNDLTQIYDSKHTKGHSNNDAETDYYDNDYDDGIKDGSPIPNKGRPGIDFPILHDIPETSFSCKEQRYKGFFGDPETRCQVWHYCDLNGGKASFLCPNGTIFSQTALTCDWWFNVKCSTTAQLYVLNERLYKFILPFTPKFPQDFQGPLVDKYLALKFKEMEEALQKEEKKETPIEDMHQQEDENEQREENESGGEGEFNAVPDKVVVETTDNTIESSTNAPQHSTQSTENPSFQTTTLVYVKEEHEKPQLESAVEIHNPGMTGHLQRLLGENL